MPKKPQKKSPAKIIRPGYDPESGEYYNSILLEEIRTQMKTVIEVVEVSHDANDRNIAEFRKEVNDEFEIVKTAIRHNSNDIKALGADVKVLKTDVQVLKTDVQVLKTDVQVLKTDVQVLKTDVKEIRVEMKEMEKRLSDKIDKVGDRVDNHEVRITNLEIARL